MSWLKSSFEESKLFSLNGLSSVMINLNDSLLRCTSCAEWLAYTARHFTSRCGGLIFQEIGSVMGTIHLYHVTALQEFRAIRVGQIAAPSAHKCIHIVYVYSEIDTGKLRLPTLQ